jgi:hypothetical protein
MTRKTSISCSLVAKRAASVIEDDEIEELGPGLSAGGGVNDIAIEGHMGRHSSPDGALDQVGCISPAAA